MKKTLLNFVGFILAAPCLIFAVWWLFYPDAQVHCISDIKVENGQKSIYIDGDKEIVIDLSAETADDALFVLLKEDGTSYKYVVERRRWLEYVNAQVGDTAFEGSILHKGRLLRHYYVEKHEGMCKNKVSCIKKLREKNADVTVVFFEDGRYIAVSPSDNMLWSELEEGDTVVERRIGQSVVYSPQP